MREHPSSQQLALYQSRALAPDVFLSIHRHISACQACSEQCNAGTRVKEDYAILLDAVMPHPDEPAYHLTKAEVVGYVNKDLDNIASELVESHLAVCAECLQVAEASRDAKSSYSFAFGTNTVGSKEQSAGHQRGALLAFIATQARPLGVAALVLLVLGAVLLALLFMRRKEADQPPGHDERANINATKREAVPANSSTGLRQIADQSATSGSGQQSPDNSEKLAADKQPGRSASTAAVPALRGGGSDGHPKADVARVVSPSLQRAIMSALTAQRIERPQVLAELGGTSGQLLSESGNGLPFQLLSPVGQVVQDLRPAFRWKPLAGAGSYEVTIVDNELNEVATSGQLMNTEWSAPVSLKQGAIYSWQVTAFKDGKRITSPVMPAPQAKFKVLDRKHSEELKRLKRALPGYHLGLGVLYTQAGLLEDAEREFEALSRDKSHSAIAAKLLKRVRSMKE